MGKVITVKHRGGFSKTEKWLTRTSKNDYSKLLQLYGEMGVRELQKATPKNTGLTAASWYYEIVAYDKGISVQWKNSNVNEGTCIAILLQYGHGTGTGGWVEGIDYINPALKPVFEELADKMWEEVTP